MAKKKDKKKKQELNHDLVEEVLRRHGLITSTPLEVDNAIDPSKEIIDGTDMHFFNKMRSCYKWLAIITIMVIFTALRDQSIISICAAISLFFNTIAMAYNLDEKEIKLRAEGKINE